MDDIPIENMTPSTDIDPAPRPEKPLWVVGIGAGAGGLEAIQLMFGALPVDSSLAFVICRRMQSGLSDPLADLLCTQTSMPVVQAEDGTRLEEGRVYLLAPEARMVLLKDRLVTFDPDADDAVELAVSPIDILLHSIAASSGEAAIAVMLSGNDEDGLRGCASIREFGGLVLAQHPETTEFADMPRRVIDADLASAVATPGAIADLIWRHVGKTQKNADSTLEGGRDDDALARITALLEARFSIDAHAYRPSLVAKRVRRRLAISQSVNLSDYADYVEAHDAELTALHDDILIRVTAFFRDPEAFAALEREVLPALIEEMTPRKPIRIWVPACASGEEAYSITMLLLDRIELAGKKPYLKVLASDRHIPAIKQARKGCYLPESLGNLPADLADRYMRKDDHIVEVDPHVRRHVTFFVHDMLKAPPPHNIGLVSCRNLLIYLATAACEKAFLACSEALKPSGFLMLGPSEQPGQQMADFTTIDGKWRLYQKATAADPKATVPSVDESLTRLIASHKRASAETIQPPETIEAEQVLEEPMEPMEPSPPSRPPHELDGMMARNQRMLESTIDTLLASNDQLRRQNRDLRTENQQLTHAHAALDDIATMIAHDLKTPLQTIGHQALQLEAMLDDDSPKADTVRCLGPLRHRTLALTRLIDDLLAYARQGPIDEADLRSVDITDLLHETLTLIDLPRGVKVLIRPRSLVVVTWQTPLACILRNLLGHAIERIGGATGAIRIETTLKEGHVDIAITDNGQQASDHDGQLGMAIVRQLLDAAGGRITSGPDAGNRTHQVRLTWPLADEAASAPSDESAKTTSDRS